MEKCIKNTTKQVIGQRMSDLRKRHNLKQQEVVDLLSQNKKSPIFPDELNIETYKSWEYGRCATPVYWFPALCEVLQCDADYLFGMIDDEKKQNLGLSELAWLNLEIVLSSFADAEYVSPHQCKREDLRNLKMGPKVKYDFLKLLLENDDLWEALSVSAFHFREEMQKFEIDERHMIEDFTHENFAQISAERGKQTLGELFKRINWDVLSWIKG